MGTETAVSLISTRIVIDTGPGVCMKFIFSVIVSHNSKLFLALGTGDEQFTTLFAVLPFLVINGSKAL